MNKINNPTLFWLDGHYSRGDTVKEEKETPIYYELRHILCKEFTEHVIVIDDARNVGSVPDYPKIKSLKKFIHTMQRNVEMSILDDMIRITPRL